MISITAIEADLNGFVVLKQDDMTPDSMQTIYNMTRRGSRVKTLDNKSVLVDCGITSSDLIINIIIQHKAMEKAFIVRELMFNYGIVNISTRLGVFQASITNITQTESGYQCTILIIE